MKHFVQIVAVLGGAAAAVPAGSATALATAGAGAR